MNRVAVSTLFACRPIRCCLFVMLPSRTDTSRSVSRLSGMARSQMPLNVKQKRIGGRRLCRDSANVVN
jgi:hypothetical protein